MTVTHLIFREITHRKWNFLLSVLSASIATACMVGALTVLNVDRLQTEHLLNEKRKAVETSGADLEDSMRKILVFAVLAERRR